MSAYKSGDKVLIKLDDPERRGVRGCFHGREGRVAEVDPAQAALKVLVAPKVQIEAIWFDFGEVEPVKSPEALVRADLEALQAAVRGLTGREGTVADMISDLADIGRALGAVRDVAAGLMGKPAPNDRVVVTWIQHVAAQHRELGEMALQVRADREALEGRIQGAMVALDALRGAWQSCESADVARAFEALERALRGVAPVTPAVEAKLAEQVKRLDKRVTALEGGVRAKAGGARECHLCHSTEMVSGSNPAICIKCKCGTHDKGRLHTGDPAAGDKSGAWDRTHDR